MTELAVNTVSEINLGTLLSDFADGDQHGWPTEFRWLWTNQSQYMADIVSSVAKDGVRTPILLSFSEMRVWDGHHRIAAAVALGMTSIPYVRADEA